MTKQDAMMETGLERLKALTLWWTGENTAWPGTIEAPVRQLQAFALDVHSAYQEASFRQIETLLAINKEITGAVAVAAGSRQPQDLLKVQSRIAACLFEGANANAKTWSALGTKIQQCCTHAVRNGAEEGKRVSGSPPSAPGRSTAQSEDKPAAKRAAQR